MSWHEWLMWVPYHPFLFNPWLIYFQHSRPLSLREEEEQDIPGWKRAALALDPNTPTPPPWKREQAASPPHWKRGADSEGSPAWKREESSIYPPPWRRTPPPTPDWKREVDTLDAPGSPDWRREPEENVPPPWKRTSERPAPPPWKRAAA